MDASREAASAVINALHQKYSGSKDGHCAGLKGAAIASAILVLLTTPSPRREQVASIDVTSVAGADQAEFASDINLPAMLGNFSIIAASSTKSIFSLVSDSSKNGVPAGKVGR